MILEFSWPPKDCKINGNAALHWSKKGAARKAYKNDCYAETLIQSKGFNPPDGNIEVRVTFHPPRNSGDLDNMLFACKGLFDGMCFALGIDDKRFRPMVLDVGEKVPGGKVIVELREQISEF